MNRRNDVAPGCWNNIRRLPSRGMRSVRERTAPSPRTSLLTRRSMTAVATAAFLLLLLGHSALLHSETGHPHHSHALLSSVGAEFAINVDHPHLVNGALTACHDVSASAVLPRTPTILMEIGVAAAMVAIVAGVSGDATTSGRSPPNAAPPALTGRDLLTRLCLIRR